MLERFLASTRAVVDAELERRLRVDGDDPGRLREAMHYAATGPGKRLRPAMTIAAAIACDTDRGALPAAIAVELLHAYTLVHDDLPAMDDDDVRRGRPTVHVAFGEDIAILAGDGLLTLAFETLAELGTRAPDAIAVLARRAGAHELLRGQAIDLTSVGFEDLAALEQLHAAKTGALFAAAAELGAIAVGAPAERRAQLARYGLAYGIAFQHVDDRDDLEHAAHAEIAARRIRELTGDARAIAAELPHGELLDALAATLAG
jgi:geranylgeranyl pyrophosphate synthase